MAAFAAVFAAAAAAELMPTIGIVGVPSSEGCDTLGGAPPPRPPGSAPNSRSCFSTVYAKWVQQSAARTVALPYDLHDSDPLLLDKLLASLNGILFTGGGLNLSSPEPPVREYMRTLSHIFNASAAKHDAGVTFPVWGTCMGLQTISILGAGGDASVVVTDAFDSEDISLPVRLTGDVQRSRLFRGMPDEAREVLTQSNSTANLHHDGVLPETYRRHAGLKEFLLLGTSVDRKGKEFVAMAEHSRYPIYAVQFHPERPQYEWTSGHRFNRSVGVARAMRYMSDFFIAEARSNGQQLEDTDAAAFSEAHSTMMMPTQPLHGGRLNFSDAFVFSRL